MFGFERNSNLRPKNEILITRGKHFKAIGPWKASAKLHIHTPSQECGIFILIVNHAEIQ